MRLLCSAAVHIQLSEPSTRLPPLLVCAEQSLASISKFICYCLDAADRLGRLGRLDPAWCVSDLYF